MRERKKERWERERERNRERWEREREKERNRERWEREREREREREKERFKNLLAENERHLLNRVIIDTDPPLILQNLARKCGSNLTISICVISSI